MKRPSERKFLAAAERYVNRSEIVASDIGARMDSESLAAAYAAMSDGMYLLASFYQHHRDKRLLQYEQLAEGIDPDERELIDFVLRRLQEHVISTRH